MSPSRRRKRSRSGRMHDRRRNGRVMTLAIALAAGSLLLGPAALISIPRYDFKRLARERPHITAVMRETAALSVAEGATIQRSWRWVPLKEMSPHLAPAFLAALDPTFYEHRGINIRGIQRELRDAWKARAWTKIAPSISRRTIRELVLGSTLSIRERPAEWVLTTRIERRLSKERILEVFLNVTHWGKGVYGVDEAARDRFGKGVHDLSLQESAMLAAAYRKYAARDEMNDTGDIPAFTLVYGTNIVLRQMERAGTITDAEFEMSRVKAGALSGK